MLRFLTAGESHGKALVDDPRRHAGGPRDRLRRDHRAAAPPPGRLRPRPPHGDRIRPRRGAQRHPPRRDDRRADRAADSEQGLGELAAHDARRSRTMPADATGADRPAVTRPRPGHADLAGFVKYGHDDMRNVLERASARETAARVAVGAIARQLLQQRRRRDRQPRRRASARPSSPIRSRSPSTQVARSPADSPLHCVDAGVERQMIAEIDRARDAGDTMGGSFEVIAHGVPPGLGSYVQWDRKLDGRLAQALMSIPGDQGGRHRPRPGGRRRARLAGPRRDPAAAPPQRAGRRLSTADQQRRRPRRRRHQRRGSAGHRLHEADLHADEAAALGRSRRR